MKPVASLLLGILLTGGVWYSDASSTARAAATDSTVTFRLRVYGAIDPTMTFWIAYGPLGGHFAVVRLRRSGAGLFAVTLRLPPARSSFAYIAGRGVVRDRSGPAPDAPIITIRRFDRSTARQAGLRAVCWHVPVG
jgi:hypothetical protein